MYFYKQEILNELICPRCEQIYVDPRIISCFETLCSNCIEELTTSENKMKCFFCEEIHEIPESGFKPNKHLRKILSKQPQSIYRGEAIKQFESKLDDLRNLINRLETTISNPSLIVNKHFTDIRNQIDLAAEQKANELNLIRIKYIEKINQFEKDCHEKYDQKNVKNLENILKQTNGHFKNCENFLRNVNIDETKIQERILETTKIYQNVQDTISKLESDQFGDVLIDFQENTQIIKDEFLGEIILSTKHSSE